jgi:glycosyltransferase involved in cell wall biosynthesis
MKWLISRYATVGIGASERAALALFGSNWKADPRWRILYCAVDLQPFFLRPDRVEVRTELSLPQDAFVMGHVGSFNLAKNHSFLLQVAAGVMNKVQRARLLLVGNGEMRGNIEAQARDLGIADRVHFAGLRSDIPRLLMGAMDVFVFPSLYEGLPLAVVEAQAAGLRVLLSDHVTHEVDIVPGAIKWLSIHESLDEWVQSVVESTRVSALSQALALVANSRFEISECLRELTFIYHSSSLVNSDKVEH